MITLSVVWTDDSYYPAKSDIFLGVEATGMD